MRKPRPSDIRMMQRAFFYCLVPLFVLNGLCALALVFLVGFGVLILSDKVIMTFLLETVAQAAAVFVIVARYLFPSPRN
jgi:hypothetical protein